MPKAKTKAETLALLREALHAWEELGREQGHPIWLVEMINETKTRIAERVKRLDRPAKKGQPALASRAKLG